ncbi:hypothetical protein FS749_010894 [Ceratobasidium sp. UAMH 11750]|nr:hypothetical protein FS749_010894 [Ceratobasidium sp. UAMH 11750]
MIPTTPVILIGYKLASNLMEHYTYPLPPVRRLIQALQRELQIPVTLVEVEDEDDDEDPTLFVCCYSETYAGPVDVTELAHVRVPDEFRNVVGMVRTEGGVKRLACPRGRVYAAGAWDKAREAGWVRV